MKTVKAAIKTEYIKLDQLLKFIGIAETGGHAKEIVAEGVCRVDGEVCTQRGRKIFPDHRVEIDDYIIQVVKEENSGHIPSEF